MKRLLALVCILALTLSLALAEEGAETLEKLPLGGPAPYGPVEGALSADGMSYDDGTLKIRIETDNRFETNVYYVYVTIKDASQLRTATAGKPRSKVTEPVPNMAVANRAVLAFNGDYYSYHDQGVEWRSGEMVRDSLTKGRDLLIIDDKGDFNIITEPSRNKLNAYLQSNQIRECYSFGPALIVDGEVQKFDYRVKTSCGYNNGAQRLAVCQLGPLEYLFIACEGPEQNKQRGLFGKELTQLCQEKGAIQAYNMDGGSSVTIWLCGQRINSPETKYRAVKDIIYFATLCGPAAE